MSKINIASVVGTVSLVLTLLTPTAATATDCSGFDGAGTSADPYLITNVSEFKNLENCQLSKHFKIANDIDFGGTEPGTGISNFAGDLNGNGKTLNNLRVSQSADANDDYLGVFEKIAGSASIKNLTIDGLELDTLADSTYSGFVAEATGNFTLENLTLRNVEQNSTARSSGGLIGEATLSETSTLAKIDIESTLSCGEFEECGGLIGRAVVQTSTSVIDRVYAKTNFASLDNTESSLNGGLIGYILPEDGFPNLDLTIQNVLVTLTNDEPGAGGRLGGVLGRIDNTIGGTTLTLILDSISVGGLIPDAKSRAALAGYFFEGGDTQGNLIFKPKEVVIAASFDAPANRTNLEIGGTWAKVLDDNEEFDRSEAWIYHDTESTETAAHIKKIVTDSKSDPDSYSELDVAESLKEIRNWYVQEPDTAGTPDGSGPDGYIGSIFEGYPVPFTLAETGFLGNRFSFQRNFGDKDLDLQPEYLPVERLGYANGGAGFDAIANPFPRDDADFLGWSDTSDDSGTRFAEGEAITKFSRLSEIFAIWQEIFSIVFELGEAEGGKVPKSIEAKPTFVVPGPTGLFKTGHEFGGWSAPRFSVVYEEGQTVTATSELRLYPVFNELFDVSFNSGGADSGSVASITDKTSITAPTKGDLVRNGFTFTGWQDQDGNDYAVGDTINLTKDLTLTAQWAELFDVSFNSGGADNGSVAAQTDKLSFTVPGQGDLVRNGFTFAGWKDQDGTSYTAGQSVNLTKDLTLTAQWTASAPPPAPAPAPYLGPLISGVEQPAESDFTTAGLQTVTVKGTRLNTVRSVVIHEITVEVTEASYSSFSFVLPAGLPAGKHDLIVRSAFGNVKYLSGVEVKEAPVAEPVIETEQTKPNQKINAGSFKGYVAVYALGHEGKRLSAKIGKDWVVIPEIPARDNNLYRVTDFTGAGVDIQVRIYIDRELLETIPLTTK